MTNSFMQKFEEQTGIRFIARKTKSWINFTDISKHVTEEGLYNQVKIKPRNE